MRKLAIFAIVFFLTSCATQDLALQDNWEECMNCGKHYDLCEEEACAD